jgi:hypothetical protein
MPLGVLRKHGVVTVEGDLVRLNAPVLSFEERARLRGSLPTAHWRVPR